MKKEEDFQKGVLDALAGLREDVGDIKKSRMDFEQRVTQHLEQLVMEYVGRIRKVVESTEREMKQFESKMRKFTADVWKIERAREKADEARTKLEDMVQPQLDRLTDIVQRNYDRLNKVSKALEKIERGTSNTRKNDLHRGS